jgi:hypothetical protein
MNDRTPSQDPAGNLEHRTLRFSEAVSSLTNTMRWWGNRGVAGHVNALTQPSGEQVIHH